MSQPAFVKKLVPEGSVREDRYDWQLRRKIRSVAFWLRSGEDPDHDFAPTADHVPKGFKAHFEKQEWFDDWLNFGSTWDVGGREFSTIDSSPLVVVPRWQTVWEENDDNIGLQMKTNEIAARKRRRGSQVHSQSDNEAV